MRAGLVGGRDGPQGTWCVCLQVRLSWRIAQIFWFYLGAAGLLSPPPLLGQRQRRLPLCWLFFLPKRSTGPCQLKIRKGGGGLALEPGKSGNPWTLGDAPVARCFPGALLGG